MPGNFEPRRILDPGIDAVRRQFARLRTNPPAVLRHLGAEPGAAGVGVADWRRGGRPGRNDRSPGGNSPSRRSCPILPPRQSAVIFLHMIGGPSQLDLFEPKPEVIKRDGQPIPESFLKGIKFAQIQEKQPRLMGSPWKFAAAWPVRRRRFRTAAAHRHDRRPSVDRQNLQGRRHQSCVRRTAAEHRLAAIRPAQHGLVGRLWAGKRIARPARLHGAALGHAAAIEKRQLRQRLFAVGLSRRAAAFLGRADSESLQPRGIYAPSGSGARSTRSTA